jgi:hypothetical protein
MSFRIFTLQLTGKIKPVEKIEAQRATLEKNYKAFLEAESSAKLADFRELDSWVKSGAMAAARKEIERLVFKGSNEHNQIIEFEALKKNKSIRNYFRIEGSPELNRFLKLKESAKLKEYYDLKDFAEGGTFLQEKRENESLKFSGSPEERHLTELTSLRKNRALRDYLSLQDTASLKRHQVFLESARLHRYLELKNMPAKEKEVMKEFRQLKSDSEIREYFRMENSKALKHYREMSGSHIPERYQELLKETTSPEFLKRVDYLKDKKKFEKTEAWKKYIRYKGLSEDPDIRFFLKFEKSPLYLNYLDTRDSFVLQRYNELLEITTSPDFLKRKAWLEDTRKWEKSDEYVKHLKYLELKKDAQIELYFRYADKPDFDFLKTWEVTFEDDFEGKNLDHGKWTPNTFWADKLLGDNFSQPGDLQAYTGGKNSLLAHSRLLLQVKKEKYRSKHWLPMAGFVPVDFDYTSDTLSTCRSFWQEGGIFEAKILYRPEKEVVSLCYLTGEQNSPMLSLIETGPKPRLGVNTIAGGHKTFEGIDLKHLKPGKFYLFRVEWESGKVVWKINDVVVHETRFNGINGAVHLNLASLVIEEVASSKLPVAFEVDWIRCYRKR